MQTRRTIEWQPFSKKHKNYIKNALRHRMNVAEGAIRSGKTIDHCIIAAMYLETCKDKIHLASGSTIGNAKLNIGVCNGFGLENLFKGRCHWGKFRDNEALYIATKTGQKVVIFAGGAKADSYKRILGNSYGLWIATEINEHYDSDDSRTSFIKVAFGRQVAAQNPLVLWDLNPCNPGNDIYKNYIDAYKKGFEGGYQYEHFTINDNLSISPERRAQIESQYVKGTVWYRRDILGERCIAEGLIYPMYEKAMGKPPEPIYVNGKWMNPPSEYVIALDYGTQNAFAAYLFAKWGRVWYAIREYYYSGRDTKIQKTDQQYLNDMDGWLADIDTGRRIQTIVDPSAASFITLLKKHEHRYAVLKADNDVSDGIRETANALDNGYLIIDGEACPNLKDELSGYRWDPGSEDDRPIKENDHGCDAVRYFVKTKHIVREALKEIRRGDR